MKVEVAVQGSPSLIRWCVDVNNIELELDADSCLVLDLSRSPLKSLSLPELEDCLNRLVFSWPPQQMQTSIFEKTKIGVLFLFLVRPTFELSSLGCVHVVAMHAEHNRVRKSQLGESGIRESILLNVHRNEIVY